MGDIEHDLLEGFSGRRCIDCEYFTVINVCKVFTMAALMINVCVLFIAALGLQERNTTDKYFLCPNSLSSLGTASATLLCL